MICNKLDDSSYREKSEEWVIVESEKSEHEY